MDFNGFLMNSTGLKLIGIKGIPLVKRFDDIATLILSSIENMSIKLKNHDIIVIAHSIVSKSEGRTIRADEIEVSDRAREIAERNDFDPIHVEIALQESISVLRDTGVLITETKYGLICNFSGVDKSNAPSDEYILLPEDPDNSARIILRNLEEKTKLNLAVIISDTQGRPWRIGTVNIAIGCAGINAFKYNRGKKDLYGRPLERSTICQVDEIAAAVEPIMGQANEGVPVVIVRGYEYTDEGESCKDIQRSMDEDLFR